MKKSVWLSLLLGAWILNAVPLYQWTFDEGENIDTETGMTEFGRTGTYDFKGLSAGNGTMIAGKGVKPEKMFEKSPMGNALRIGRGNGIDNNVSTKLPEAISGREGSISFWVCPEDWKGTDKGNMRIFAAGDDGRSPRQNELLVYKYHDNDNVIFLLGNLAGNEYASVQLPVANWQTGEWHFVCASWTTELLRLQIDVEVAESKRIGPQADFSQIVFGTREWEIEYGHSLLDNVQISDEAVDTESGKALYRRYRSAMSQRLTPMTQRISKCTAVPDGVMNDWEYSLDMNMSFDIFAFTLATNSRFGLACDDDNLYMAYQGPIPLQEPKVKEMDGTMWEDDNIEFHLQRDGKHWQFIFNGTQAFYDSLESNSIWNSDGVRVVESRADTRWTMEVVLPWKNFGGSPLENEAFYLGLTRSGQDLGILGRDMALSPMHRSYTDFANYLKICMEPKAVPVRFHFEEFPCVTGHFRGTAEVQEGNAAYQLCFMEKNGRKLYDQTVSGTRMVQDKAELASDGQMEYSVTKDGVCIAEGVFGYASIEPLRVSYIKTRLEDQVLETCLDLKVQPRESLVVIERMTGADGATVLEKEVPLATAKIGRMTLELPVNELSQGRYDYTVYTREMDGAEEIKQHHQMYFKPSDKEPWNVREYGEISKPLPPWTEPLADEQKLSCLLQTYSFANTLFPAQVTAKKRKLLAEPMALIINGKTIAKAESFEILEQTPLQITFRTKAVAEGVDFDVQGVLEFDGWMRFELTYAPHGGKSVEIRDLSFLMPFAGNCSRLVSLFEPPDITRKYMSGSLGDDFRADLSSHPVFWIGDAEYGIFWGADSLRGTHLRNINDTMRMERRSKDKAAMTTVRLVDEPFALDAARTIAFGIQATPVKEPRAEARCPWMLNSSANIMNFDVFTKCFNYHNPEFCRIPEFQAHLAEAMRNHQPYYGVYAAIYGVSPYCPEWPWYAEQWLSSPPELGHFKQDFPVNSEDARNQGLWAFGCVNEPEFLRWQLYWLANELNSKPMWHRDFYFDMAYPRACDNEKHGCGWYDDFGVKRMTYPINANREFTKRLRKVMLDNDPKGIVQYHTSSEPLVPVCSFVDELHEGEVFVSRVAQEENYYQIFTPELFQSCFIGGRCGTKNSYGPQFSRSCMMMRPERYEYWRRPQKEPAAVHAVRHFLAYCLLHDVRPYAGACIEPEGIEINKRLAENGFSDDDIVFVPYWNEERAFTASNGVMLSYYQLHGFKTILVLLNDTDQDVMTAVAGPLDNSKVMDLEDCTTLDAGNIALPARGMKLILVR